MSYFHLQECCQRWQGDSRRHHKLSELFWSQHRAIALALFLQILRTGGQALAGQPAHPALGQGCSHELLHHGTASSRPAAARGWSPADRRNKPVALKLLLPSWAGTQLPAHPVPSHRGQPTVLERPLSSVATNYSQRASSLRFSSRCLMAQTQENHYIPSWTHRTNLPVAQKMKEEFAVSL